MILNIAVALLVLLIAYMWTAQGLFSAMLHFVCTVAAGAIAFAAWEPLTYGLLLGVHKDYAWTVGLVGPFVLALLALRVTSDKLVPSEPKLPGSLDFVGGGVFGAGSGIIAAGIMVIGVGFMPLGAEMFGHRGVEYDASGNLVRSSSLWVPADELTAAFYEHLSTGAFAVGGTALARRMPEVEAQAALVRLAYDNRAKTAIAPDDFEITGSYTVAAGSLDELTADGFAVTPQGEPQPQDVKALSGEPLPENSVIRGYRVKFNSGAAESSGQTVIGAGQARLVCRLPEGGSAGYQAVAVIAQADGSSLAASRFRFDTADVFIGSSRAANPVMAFEFVVPADAEPTDLLIKQARTPVSEIPAGPEYTVEERDDAVYALELIEREEEGPDTGRPDPAASAPTAAAQGPIDGTDRQMVGASGVRVTPDLRGLTLSRQQRGSLRVNDDNLITGGTHTFATDDITNVNVPTQLRVEGFDAPPSVRVVQVNVSLGSRASVFGRALDAAERVLPPILTDTLGQPYEAVGYVFAAGDRTEIRYEPADPLRAMSELPSLSRSRPNDKLTLLFQVNDGVDIKSFSLGGQVEILTFSPPVSVGR